MASLPGGPPAVNAGGADPATPSATSPPSTPPHPLLPPFPPCPECGGEVMRYLSRDTREDELLCLDCWWAAPTPRPPAAGGEGGG
jgi:hypothetical protein